MNKIKDTTFIIPARMGSKGLPFKNRKLFKKTADILVDYSSKVIVTTDDPDIIQMSNDCGFILHKRKESLANDHTSMLSVVDNVIEEVKIVDKFVSVLYLTYPERTMQDIESAFNFFNDKNAKSLLCKKKIKTHPYLTFLEKSNNKGELLIKHPFYRRQDYPTCFEVSHFISLFLREEVVHLNHQLYNEDTVFYSIDDMIDIDEEKDLKLYVNKNNS
jgi:hypothetical protein